MQADTLIVLRERVVFGNTTLTNDAGNSLRLGHALLLHKKLEGAITPTAGRHFEHAGLVAFAIDNGPNVQALQQRALRDAFGELLDRDTRAIEYAQSLLPTRSYFR